MTPRWRLKATKTEGGFSLRLIDSDGDLGEAFNDGINRGEQIVIVMDDGRELGLLPALAELIQSRVIEITVQTELTATVPLSGQRQSAEPEERVH